MPERVVIEAVLLILQIVVLSEATFKFPLSIPYYVLIRCRFVKLSLWFYFYCKDVVENVQKVIIHGVG